MAKRVIVVGGGIVGCLTALALSDKGCSVTLVERNVVAAQTSGESSWAGAGILFPLLPWMYQDAVNQLAMAGAALYPTLCERLLAETRIDPEYTQSGLQILPSFDEDAAINWCKNYQVPIEKKADGLLLPTIAQVRPPHLLQALRQILIQENVTLLENTQLEPLASCEKISSWRAISSSHSTGLILEADAFVVTSGAWSFDLLKETAAGLNIKPMRGQILLYENVQEKLENIIYSNGFYLVPRRDGLLLAGSTLEDVGFDTRTTEEVKQELQTKAESILPGLKHAIIRKHWSGLRPGTPDNLPTIAAHPSIQNLYLNTGHFRYGLTMAPESAQRVAALVCT
ncbi:MAG: FAD-dependent oxidoreductase [Bdellovibrio sp.]|nr:FAD-dependent oxidoreductase [Methylotenera sp.]